MTDYCAFSKDHHCIKYEDYEATRFELEEVDEAAKKEIADALKFAEESEYPDPSEAITEEYGTDNERGVAR